jgi:hypothetical protein
MNYTNPDEFWQQSYDPYKGLSDDDMVKAGCLQLFTFVVILLILLALCALVR